MNEQQFTQLLGGIDPALIARAEAPVPMRKKPQFKLMLIAAVLALLACTALVITPFIPTTLEIDYITSPTDGTEIAFGKRNVWIYYTTENGKQKREYVRLPGDDQNVFAAWAHLNGLDESYMLHSVEYTDEATLAGRYVIVTCSAALQEHPNAQALRASLQKTFAHSMGIPVNQVAVHFSDPLQFSHDLTDTPIRVKSGETFTVTVTMTNVSDKDIVFKGAESDFVPKAKLRAKFLQYSLYEIDPLMHESTGEIAEYRLAPGESKSVTYTFRIPYAKAGLTAMTGYDLIVSFGKQSQTFEQVTTVVLYFAASGARSAFENFTLSHTCEDRTELQSIWGSYTYQGESIMEQMRIWSDDGSMNDNPVWNEGGNIMQGEQLLFEYSNSAIQLRYGWIEIQSYSFTATALPDGMTLPMGITEQDSILDALIKMGVDEQTALEYLAREGTIQIAGNTISDMTSSSIDFEPKGTIDLVCNANHYLITCTLKKMIIPGSDPYPHATRSFSLAYDRDSQSFLGIRFDITLPTRPSITFDALPTFTLIGGEKRTITLTQEQADILRNAMTNGTWKSSVQDAEYDCKGMIGDIEIGYASKSGILQVGSFSVQFGLNDWIEVNKMLELPVQITLQ